MIRLLRGDCLARLTELQPNSIDSLVTDPPAGISFMGKEWDANKGGRKEWIGWLTQVAAESMRVLKPGAHGLVWALPRTSHWTATALEDAGFEIRDVVTHHFGTGFPKSLDVSKAIDKAAGAERIDTGETYTYPDGTKRKVVISPDTYYYSKLAGSLSKTAPATDAAKQWQGWGTALKPASEHWILVRKPLDKATVAANVIEYGTGALNIDGARITATAEDIAIQRARTGGIMDAPTGNKIYSPGIRHPAGNDLGRWPANLILSHSDDCGDVCAPDCPVAELDRQSGDRPARNFPKKLTGNSLFGLDGHVNANPHSMGDTGGASRFFYVAKSSTAERNTGLADVKNTHPTVKALALMRYLCRLITPPGGIVLDPFAGSGSTGVAAIAEGFGFVGVERDPEYFAIAKARILAASNTALSGKGV